MNGYYINEGDILDQLQALGLDITTIVVGAPQRVKHEGGDQKAWYSLHEVLLKDGRPAIIGAAIIWKGPEKFQHKLALRIDDKAVKLDADQSAAFRLRMAEEQQKAERIRKGRQARAAKEAARAWGKYSTTGECDYLDDKQIQAHGVKFTAGNSLVIPMMDTAHRIHGLQLIYPKGHPKRAKTGRNKDFWPAGLAKAGHFHQIGVVRDLILIAEGYATAATLYEATALPVAVAFDAGNLQPVAIALHKHYPKARILICADDDFQTEGNPGTRCAATAAMAVGGAWVAPVFATERTTKLTDFNDLAIAEGQGAVLQQITQRLAALEWSAAPASKPREAHTGGEGSAAEEDLRAITDLDELHERYSLVYDMKAIVFDHQERALVGVDSQRNICISRQLHRQWMESSEKRIVRTREVGFDPTEKDASIKCNLFDGFPAIGTIGEAHAQLETLEYQCSFEENVDLFTYVLRWLAYPLQHVGAKMTTALLLHGPQGVGKNIIFERSMIGIYGKYGAIVGQDQLDSKHNRWQSRKLYMLCDEIMTRAELYQNKNRVKGMITSDWITINPKGVDEYMERNHCNFVFSSNEIQPLALERDDRRFTVIWTPGPKDKDFYRNVGSEQRDGGIAAFRDYLMRMPLADHNPHTEALYTRAKAELILLGMDSIERFWIEWTNNTLPLPVVACKSVDFYNAYRWWCHQNGIGKPAQSNTLLAHSAKRPGAAKLRKRIYRDLSVSTDEQAMIMFPPAADRGATIRELTISATDFSIALDAWKDDAAGAPPLRRVK